MSWLQEKHVVASRLDDQNIILGRILEALDLIATSLHCLSLCASAMADKDDLQRSREEREGGRADE